MNAYVTVATFKAGTDMNELTAHIPQEVAQVERLRTEKRMGAVHVSFARGTVFIEVFALDEAGARETLETLPLARWLNFDLFPISQAPGRPQ